TNHKTDGIYLPADDRRHFVAWSNIGLEDFAQDYWRKLYHWYAKGGNEAVAAYLANLDLSGFDPKAPPTKTSAVWEVVNANRAPGGAGFRGVPTAGDGGRGGRPKGGPRKRPPSTPFWRMGGATEKPAAASHIGSKIAATSSSAIRTTRKDDGRSGAHATPST